MKGVLKWVHSLVTARVEDSLVSSGLVSFRVAGRDAKWTQWTLVCRGQPLPTGLREGPPVGLRDPCPGQVGMCMQAKEPTNGQETLPARGLGRACLLCG